jgi:predicted metal-dependent HD superfamily phosphohydrolase
VPSCWNEPYPGPLSGDQVDGKEPALEEPRWVRLWTRLGARGSGLPEFERLQAAYAEPTRTYHTAAHIQDCLTAFDHSRDLARHPDSVEAAIWFHDAVYIPDAPDNEERSAQLAERDLRNGGVSPDIVLWVGRLVRTTTHQQPPDEPDAQLLCDIDLSILGREVAAYDEFERRIRREYALVPETVYRRGRSELLESFLARPSIYLTERFRSQYERPARTNLARALSRLATRTGF